MNRIALATIALSSFAGATSALAHPGNHTHHDLSTIVAHWLTSPFHLMGLGLAALFIVSAIAVGRRFTVERKRSTQRRR